MRKIVMLEVVIPESASDAEAAKIMETIRQDAEHYTLCALAYNGFGGALAGAAIVGDDGSVQRAELRECSTILKKSETALDFASGNAKMIA